MATGVRRLSGIVGFPTWRVVTASSVPICAASAIQKVIDLDGDIKLDALTDDLLAVLDHAGADRVHYCGESMGGILGLTLAALHPKRIASLALVSTPVFIDDRMKKR